MEKQLLATVLQVQAQLKVLHWQTESYAEHIAFDTTLSDLDGLFDKIIEVYSGKYKRPKFGGIFQVTVADYGNVKVEAFLDTTLDYFNNLFIAAQDSELANLRDEVKAALEKLKYLLTLK